MRRLERSPAAAMPTGRIAVRATACALVALVIGCKSVDFRAAEMPEQYRIPPANRTSDLDLARMAGPGLGTSQIAPGDLVELSIGSGRSDEIVEPMQVRVSRAGQLAVPLVGEVPVAGLEPFEAEQRIAAAAVERDVYRQPSVTLQVTEQAVNRVTVLGAVANPGIHSLPRGSSDLANAIAAAGGLTEEAGTKVDVLRHESPSFYADGRPTLNAPTDDGIRLISYDQTESSEWSPTEDSVAARTRPTAGTPQTVRLDLAQAEPTRNVNHRLSDRDVVMVLPEEKRLIHVTGLVKHANQFELPRNQDVTILDAIALAGGISSPVADKVYIIRRTPEKAEPIIIKASIAKAKLDGNENLRLGPGDLVSVETTPATMFVDTATSFFRMTLGLGSNIATF